MLTETSGTPRANQVQDAGKLLDKVRKQKTKETVENLQNTEERAEERAYYARDTTQRVSAGGVE